MSGKQVLEDPFETEKSSRSGSSSNAREWKGLLFFFIWISYWFKFLLWGRRAVPEPKPFDKTSDFKWFFYAGYRFKLFLKKFFKGPFKESSDLNFVEKMTLLFDTDPSFRNPNVIQISKDLTKLHRIHENTKARRRLEKWASRVIVIYLLIVLCLVLGNYIKIEYSGILSFMSKISMDIPKPIMITILSTTTVNIIGLGLIVLRGHFLSRNDLHDDLAGTTSQNPAPTDEEKQQKSEE